MAHPSSTTGGRLGIIDLTSITDKVNLPKDVYALTFPSGGEIEIYGGGIREKTANTSNILDSAVGKVKTLFAFTVVSHNVPANTPADGIRSIEIVSVEGRGQDFVDSLSPTMTAATDTNGDLNVLASNSGSFPSASQQRNGIGILQNNPAVLKITLDNEETYEAKVKIPMSPDSFHREVKDTVKVTFDVGDGQTIFGDFKAVQFKAGGITDVIIHMQ